MKSLSFLAMLTLFTITQSVAVAQVVAEGVTTSTVSKVTEDQMMPQKVKEDITNLQAAHVSHNEIEEMLTYPMSAPSVLGLPLPNTDCLADSNYELNLGWATTEIHVPPTSDFVWADAYCDWGNWNKYNCVYRPGPGGCVTLFWNYCNEDLDLTRSGEHANELVLGVAGSNQQWYPGWTYVDWRHYYTSPVGTSVPWGCVRESYQLCCPGYSCHWIMRYFVRASLDGGQLGSNPAPLLDGDIGLFDLYISNTCPH